MSNDLTQAELKRLLHYDPETGVWTWTENAYYVVRGKQAGNVDNDTGYRNIGFGSKRFGKRLKFKSARLAYFYMTGEWPTEVMDHINGIKDDDRWCNLRSVTLAENAINSARMPRKASGLPRGVTKHGNGYQVQLMVNRCPIHLGRFKTSEEAHAAYLKAMKEIGRDCYLPGGGRL